MGPYGAAGLPPTKQWLPPNPFLSLPNFHISYSGLQNQHADHRAPHTHACIAQRASNPISPPSVINLKPVDKKASSIFQLSLFWNLPSCLQGPPQLVSEPQSYFIYIFPPENTHRHTKHPRWHTLSCMYSCDLAGPCRISAWRLLS